MKVKSRSTANAKKVKLKMAKEGEDPEEEPEVAAVDVVVAAEAEVDAKMLLVRNVLLKKKSLREEKTMLLVAVTESEDLADLVAEMAKTMATVIEPRQVVIVKSPEMMGNAAITEGTENAEDQELLMVDLKKAVFLVADVVALVVHAVKAEAVVVTKVETVNVEAEAATKEMVSAEAMVVTKVETVNAEEEAATKEMVSAEAEAATKEMVSVEAEAVTKEMVNVEVEVVTLAVKAETRAHLAITIEKATLNLDVDAAAHAVVQEAAKKPLSSEHSRFYAQINFEPLDYKF